MKKWILIAIGLVMLSSCNCTKRMARLQVKCPDLFMNTVIRDTVVIVRPQTDTVFVTKPYDTINFEVMTPSVQTNSIMTSGSSTRVKVIRALDTIYLTIHEKPDTVFMEKSVPVTVACGRKHKTGISTFFEVTGIIAIAYTFLALLLFIYKKH